MNEIKNMLKKANSYLEKEKFVKAADIFKQIVQHDSSCIEAHKGLGHCYYQTFLCYEKVFKEDLENNIFVASVSTLIKPYDILEKAKLSFKKALELENNDENIHLDLANIYWSYFAEEEKAEYHWKRALSININFDSAYFGLGKIEFNRDNLDEAISHISKAIQLNNKMPEYFYVLGKAFFNKGDWGESIKCLESAINLNSTYSEAIMGLGSAYLQIGKRKDAIEVWRRFIQLEPTSGTTYDLKSQYPELIH